MERLTKHWGNNCVPTKLNLDIMLTTSNEQADRLMDIVKKLADYEDAEEQGLLPRFHLGDEFWALRLGRVVKAKVVMLQQKKDGTWRYRFSQEISENYHNTHDYEESDYGKYFWSTKEEAEQNLESMQKGRMI